MHSTEAHVRLLLDTHALLWWLGDAGLATEAREAIATPRNSVFVSAASTWEISIKQSLGKLSVDGDVLKHVAQAGFDELPITLAHGLAAGQLPSHHKDPFDRMLIAQAQLEGLTIVTRDQRFRQYDVPLLTV